MNCKTHLDLLLEVTKLVYTFNAIAQQKSIKQGLNFSLTNGILNIIHYESVENVEPLESVKYLGSCIKGFNQDEKNDCKSLESLNEAVAYLNQKVLKISEQGE